MDGTAAGTPADAESAPPGEGPRRQFGRRLRAPSLWGWRRMRRLWRRSLQFRVVVITLALGTLVLLAVGGTTLRQVGQGLADEKRVSASAEALQLTRRAQSQFDGTDKVQSQEAISQASTTIVQDIAGTERSRYVVLARLAGNSNTVIVGTTVSGELGLSAIPEELREAVAEDSTIQHQQIVTVTLSGQEPVSAWVFGQQVDVPLAGPYGLYFVYPMEREARTMSIVTRTYFAGGLALILLFGGIGYTVTRLIVSPVRHAAEVAERFAAGRLTERIPTRGEDDLASLATSFNAMAESLQRQIDQLENLSRVQQRFVSDVSHELRTPLTTIRMAGDLIHDSRDTFPPAVTRSAELLHDELDRFEALLSDLLEISRFDAGAAALDLEPVDLRVVVNRVVGASDPLARRRGSQVVVDEPDQPVVAEIDSRRVERILRNLVVNAIEHGEGRPVSIRTAGNVSAVAVTVRDHGVGLRPGEAALVFNRFWRADPARARTSGGTGLGLAIALEDARLHAGWLQAWGVPEEGSCFRLTLPRTSGTPIQTSPLPLNPLVSAGEGEPARLPRGDPARETPSRPEAAR